MFSVYVAGDVFFLLNSVCQEPAARPTENARAQIPTDGKVLHRVETDG